MLLDCFYKYYNVKIHVRLINRTCTLTKVN